MYAKFRHILEIHILKVLDTEAVSKVFPLKVVGIEFPCVKHKCNLLIKYWFI